ncbi:hypothetical protein MHYP_G00029960, partial [Metynnis hypsauchen]
MFLLLLLLTSMDFSYEIVTLDITEGQTTTFTFDFCDIVSCPGPSHAKGYLPAYKWRYKWLLDADKYMCIGPSYQNNPTTVCRNWDEVWWNTGVKGYTHKQSTPKWKQLQNSIALIQGQSSPQPCRTGCIPLYLTFKDATPLMQGTYGLGADLSGTDPIGRFKVRIMSNTPNTNLPSPAQSTPKFKSSIKTVSLRDSDEVIAVETGFTDTNRWIDWIHYTAHTLGAHDCYACSTAKPVLMTAPFPALLNDRHRVT